ncbi:DegT/DnrJ/EryC1/StrS family aminotransferase [Amycolatopsis sp. NPDC004079]|uniref:DegT/DnrJ/EryC1/StrS family aminotransferase n=1 Tax=Amycolatopsis sp. NPDC004079 TaxID=3154549 RepID=UPI0033B52156
MSALAVNGGTPILRSTEAHFSWPPITQATVTAVGRQLAASVSIYDRSGVVAELEDRLQEYFGVRHAVLTSSGTAAVHSAYVSAGIGPGDEVIVPAYTFLATATPLLHLGAVPVLADSDETGNISVSDVEARITDKTTAIMATHLWGIPADVGGLREVATRHGLALLEDGSHAHGAEFDGRRIGGFGMAGAFSMNGPKPLSAGEGGFVLTDDDAVYHQVLLHGHYNKRCRNEIPAGDPVYPYGVSGMGLKFRIHPLAAAIALEQLDHLDEYLAGRAEIATYLCDQLGSLPGISVPKLADRTQSAWYGLPLIYIPEELSNLPIDRFHGALHAEGLREVDRPGSTCPLNRLPLFQNPSPVLPHYPNPGKVSYRSGQFPVAEQVWHHTLKLPVWHRAEDLPLVESYISGFRKVIEHHNEILG